MYYQEENFPRWTGIPSNHIDTSVDSLIPEVTLITFIHTPS